MSYLVESPEIEKAFLAQFENHLSNLGELLISFGIDPMHSWYLFEVPMNHLVTSLEGDVDILVGKFDPISQDELQRYLDKFKRLTPNAHPIHLQRYAEVDLVQNGGLLWPPALDTLIGLEVKCSYLPLTASEISEDEIRAKKSSKSKIRGLRIQIEKLLNMGFDKVALLEFIASPPADGVGSQPWSRASYMAGRTLDAMDHIFRKRLPEDSPAGHGVGAISGVIGRDECGSGAFSFDVIRSTQENSLLKQKEVKNNRHEMENNLRDILNRLPKPHLMPAFCSYNQKTRKLNLMNSGSVRF